MESSFDVGMEQHVGMCYAPIERVEPSERTVARAGRILSSLDHVQLLGLLGGCAGAHAARPRRGTKR